MRTLSVVAYTSATTQSRSLPFPSLRVRTWSRRFFFGYDNGVLPTGRMDYHPAASLTPSKWSRS